MCCIGAANPPPGLLCHLQAADVGHTVQSGVSHLHKASGIFSVSPIPAFSREKRCPWLLAARVIERQEPAPTQGALNSQAFHPQGREGG